MRTAALTRTFGAKRLGHKDRASRRLAGALPRVILHTISLSSTIWQSLIPEYSRRFVSSIPFIWGTDRLGESGWAHISPCDRVYVRLVAPYAGDQHAPLADFQNQVWLWLEVWTADRPHLREQARQLADPRVDPWGYLAHLGELILVEG